MPVQEARDEPSQAEREDPRGSVQVMVVNPKFVLVGTSTTPLQFDFTADFALKRSRAFAQALYDLAEEVAEQQPDETPDPGDPEAWQKLEESLRQVDPLPHLVTMRKVGAEMRAKLGKAIVEQLQYHDFLTEGGGDEPALTFVEESPVLWEMIYNGTQSGLPDWQRFWGFRVPIVHWHGRDRTKVIDLQQGFFSAINEELEFAGREVELLAEELRAALPHETLTAAFEERIRQALHDNLHKADDEIEAWLAASPEMDARNKPRPTWLARYLEETTPDETMRDIVKEGMLVEILQQSFHHNLLHFACHCDAAGPAQFLTRLDLKVAGEVVSLDSSLIATDLRREFKSTSPGPLVFLNACRTSSKLESHEPPPLPEGWISAQGAVAVVVTVCPVPDYFAHAFALKFYEYLFEFLRDPESEQANRRRYVGEALLDTRRYFMKEFNNPLGLAYVLYAFQNVRVGADFYGGGGTT